MIYLIIVSLLISSTFSFFIGIYLERRAWNMLIRKGKIPKPYNMKAEIELYKKSVLNKKLSNL